MMKYSVLCLVPLLIFGSMSPATAKLAPVPRQERLILDKVTYSWDRSCEPIDGATEINITVADDGKLINPRIVHSSSNFQYDAECLEALCSLTLSEPPPLHEPTVETKFSKDGFTTRFYQSPAIQPFSNGWDIKSFISHNPQSKKIDKQFVVIHKIPLIVLRHYGVFRQNELLNERNLIKVRIETSVKTAKNSQEKEEIQPRLVKAISDYYSYWGTLFAEPDVTREKILDWAEKAPKLD